MTGFKGTIERLQPGGGGTVTSINVSGGTTGLTFTGGPITTSGTITMSGVLDPASGGTGGTTGAWLLGGNTLGVGATGTFGSKDAAAVQFLISNTSRMQLGSLGIAIAIGSQVPAARLHIASNISSTAWGINGIGIRVDAATLTNTNSSGTVSSQVAHAIGIPTFGASSPTTITDAANFFIGGVPVAGTNVTITNAYSLYVASDAFVSGKFGVNGPNGTGLGALFTIGTNNYSRTAWGTSGAIFRVNSQTITDTNSSGTVAAITGSSFAVPTFAASNVTTFNRSYGVYIAGVPTAGTNATLANNYAFAVNGYSAIDKLGIGGRSILFTSNAWLDISTATANMTGTFSQGASVGILFNITSSTLTETSSSGTVPSTWVNMINPTTLAASNPVTLTNTATLNIVGPPVAGTNVTITNSYAIYSAGGAVAFSGNNTAGQGGVLSLGLIKPAAVLHIQKGLTESAWGLNGIVMRYVAGNYTDSSSSGTVAAAVSWGFGSGGNYLASSPTTYTTAANVYIGTSPNASTNVTITNAYSLWVDAGNCRFDGFNTFGTVVTPVAKVQIGGGFTSGTAWGVAGVGLNVTGFTVADSVSSGTVASVVINSIGTSAISATNSTTYTNAAQFYISGPVTASTNVTITNNWSLWIDSGNFRLDGNLDFSGIAGGNIVTDTTTGTKIGTATTQKFGFWNATPIVQPTTAVAAATFVANTSGIADDTATFDGYTIGQVVKALRNIGILA